MNLVPLRVPMVMEKVKESMFSGGIKAHFFQGIKYSPKTLRDRLRQREA